MLLRVRDGLLPPSTAPFPTNRRPWYSGAECRLLIQAYTTVPYAALAGANRRGVRMIVTLAVTPCGCQAERGYCTPNRRRSAIKMMPRALSP